MALAARTRGVLLGLCAGLLLGSLTVSGRPLSQSLPPPAVAALCYLVAGLLVGIVRLLLPSLAPSFAVRVRSDGRWRLPASVGGRLRLCGSILFGAVLGPLLLFIGLQQTTAGAAAVVLTAEVALTVIAAMALLSERVGRTQGVGVALVLAATLGVALSTRASTGGLGSSVGNLLVLAAAVCWAADNTLTKGLATAEDQLGTIAIKGTVGGAALAIATLLGGLPLLPAMGLWPLLLAAGGLGVGASLVCYLAAVDRIGTLQATVLLATSGLCGALLAGAVGQEPLDAVAVAGGLAVVGGVVLLLAPDRGPSEGWRDDSTRGDSKDG